MDMLDVNIERIDVNGVCVGCLNPDRKMFYHDRIKECFKLVANIDLPDLKITVCWECLAYINNIFKFRNTIKASYEVLCKYTKKNLLLECPLDVCKHSKQRLKSLTPEVVSFPPDNRSVVDFMLYDDSCDATLRDDVVENNVNIAIPEVKLIEEHTPETNDILKEFRVRLKPLECLQNPKNVTKSSPSTPHANKNGKKSKKSITSIVKSRKKTNFTPSKDVKSDGALSQVDHSLPAIKRCNVIVSELNLIENANPAHCLRSGNKNTPKVDSKSNGLTRIKSKSLSPTKESSKTGSLKTITSQKEYTCNKCSTQYCNSYSLRRHMLSHTGEKPFSCDTCPYRSHSKAILKCHQQIHTGVKLYVCKDCKRKFRTKWLLQLHGLSHSKEKLYRCDLCPYRCNYKERLKLHLRKHTGDKPFSCHLCSYKGSTKRGLNLHMVRHTGKNQYNCEYCPFKCAVKAALVVHTRKHTGEKPFSCQYCPYKGSTKDKLKCHIRSHTGEKPFGCKLCSYKGATKEKLKQHIRTHTGEKPLSCKYCSAKFSNHSNVITHMRIHTNVKPYACPYCPYKSSQSGTLKRHVRASHSDKKEL